MAANVYSSDPCASSSFSSRLPPANANANASESIAATSFSSSSYCSCLPLRCSMMMIRRRSSLRTSLRSNIALHGQFRNSRHRKFGMAAAMKVSAALGALDLTEENVRKVLQDARSEFEQIFDASVGITGEAELADLDGPYVKLRFRGKFWHKRSTVLARLANYLKKRIPEIVEVDIEDENQLDDSPASF